MKAFEEEQQQTQAQQQKIDEQEVLAKELANAQKQQMLAAASERKSRERSNLGLEIERISEAVENNSQAALNRAKTLTEISELRNDQVLKVLEFVNMLDRQELEDRQNLQVQLESKAQGISESIESKAEQGVQPNQAQPGLPQQPNLGV